MTGRSGAAREDDALLGAARQLRTAAEAVALPLEIEGAARARRGRTALVAQLDDYVLPRLSSLDAPLLAVVGGSTGAGKSTLVNSLFQRVVSRSGVLRPTTRSPVLVHHPQDARWFGDRRILPGLARVPGADGAEPAPSVRPATHPAGHHDPNAAISTVHLVASDALPAGLALLDAPDIDSVVTAHRELSQQLLAAADLWLFVTTAARYADAVPWDLLDGAAARGAAVAVILNRVPAEGLDEVRTHLAQMLRERGLRSAPLFVIPEVRTDEQGLVDAAAIRPVRSWLVALARDSAARKVVVRRTLTGAVGTLRPRAAALVEAAVAQQDALAELRSAVDTAYADAASGIARGISDGTLLRGEVLARWQEFVGTGEMLRSLEARVGRLRDRIAAALRGRPAPAAELGEALQSGVEALVTAQVLAASDAVLHRWRATAGGPALVGAHPNLAEQRPDLTDVVTRMVRDWQSWILDLVRREGQGRRTAARMLSFGVNGSGVLLMLVVFSQTGGLTGAEVGIAGGTAAVAQRLLEAVFGDQAVRTLAAAARTELVRRCEVVLAGDRVRFDEVLDDVDGPPADASSGEADAHAPDAVGALRAAVQALAVVDRPRGRR